MSFLALDFMKKFLKPYITNYLINSSTASLGFIYISAAHHISTQYTYKFTAISAHSIFSVIGTFQPTRPYPSQRR